MSASQNGKNDNANASHLSKGKAYNPYPQRPSVYKKNSNNRLYRNQYPSSPLQIIDTNTRALLHGPPSSSRLSWTSTQISRELACLSIADLPPLRPLLSPSHEPSSSSSNPTTTVMTTSIPFHEFLSRLQQGTEPTVEFKNDKDYIRIPEEYLFNPYPTNDPKSTLDKRRFFDQCYLDANSASTSSSSSSMYGTHMILTTYDSQTTRYNDIGLNKLPSDAVLYSSKKTTLDGKSLPHGQDWRLDDMKRLRPYAELGRPLLSLRLKVGLPIMLLEKIDEMCAGSIVIIEKLEDDAIFAREAVRWSAAAVWTGFKEKGREGGEAIEIRRQEYIESTNIEPLIAYKRLQFPIKYAFALAVNDVREGMMFDGLGLDLTYPLLTPGKLSSTLSRCRDPSRLKVYAPNGRFPGQPGHYTRNRLF